MAAVVALLLQGKVLPKDVIIWLKKEQKQDCSTALQLLNQTNLKSEFVPYLLDNLREQSSPLLVSSQSNGCSPVKTPRSLSRSASSTRTSSNRVQLFVSPNKNASPRLQLTTPKTDRQSVTPRSAKSEDSFSRKEFVYSPYSPYFEDSKHRDSHYTPRHKSLAQSRDHATNLSPEILLPRGYRKKTGDDDRYKGQYHQSPGTKRKSGNKRRSNEHKLKSVNEIHLDSLEDFPPISKPVVTRRIKPTPVSGDRLQNRTQTLFTSSPSLPSEQSAFTASEINHNQIETKTLSTPCKALDEERELLRIERQKQKVDVIAASPHKSELPLTGPITPTKSSINTMCKVEVIQPRRDRVTCINQLNLLADIYSCCVQEFLVPNITVELYFIIQLLTSRCISEETLSEDFSQDSEEINYLRTAHNCVFFAVTVLAKLHVHRLLSFLDKATVRLLTDNPRVGEFSSDLKCTLSELSAISSNTGCLSAISSVPSVAFQADTDNKTNFPNEKSFHQFKKQRDLFYELIRTWEDHRHETGWTMKTAMAHKIWELVHHQLEFANFAHFVRLFQSQLIKMCKGGSTKIDDTGNSDDMYFLQQLRKQNPEKLKRLQERLITPLSHGGPSPAPTFPGSQEFFHSFILIADSHAFNQHLMDSLSAKIMQINRMDFSLEGNSEEESEMPNLFQEQRDTLLNGLLTSKILGKFLGLVVFLPYQSPDKLPSSLQSSIIAIRNQSYKPLDILSELQLATEQDRLILTLPWVIDYISMMDSIAPYLEYYHSVLDQLLKLYRHIAEALTRSRVINCNYILMLVLLGWLFEIPVFPEGFFFKVYDDCFMKDSVLPITTTTAASNSLSLDSMDLIDQHFLYLCCPFLSELRVLLLESAVGMRSQGGMYKKITPIAADKITEDNSTAKKSAFTLVEKQLQSKLIENFYHNQPESVKKIIDFVCERVVSNCKTQILTRLLVGIFQTELKEISNIIKEDLSTEEEPDTAKIKKKLFGKIQIACVNAQATVASQGKRYCQNKCLKCIKLLLPENTKGEVVKVSSNIASQLTYEKIYQWIQHDFTAKLNKNLSVEVEQLLMDDKVLAYRETNKEHKDSKDETCVPTSTSLILQLKELLSKMRCCETNNKFVLKEMDSLLQTVSLIYLSRKDKSSAIWCNIGELIVELMSTVIKYHPQSCNPVSGESQSEVLCTFVHLYNEMKDVISFKSFLSMSQLYDMYENKESWLSFLLVIEILVNSGLLCWNVIESSLLKWFESVESINHDVSTSTVELMGRLYTDDCNDLEEDDFVDIIAILVQKCSDHVNETILPGCFSDIIVL